LSDHRAIILRDANDDKRHRPAAFEIARAIHCIDRENAASQGVARRLGAEKAREVKLFGQVADMWVTTRRAWTSPND
jgi:RimJ/RimL family protein N-acetyltransferase